MSERLQLLEGSVEWREIDGELVGLETRSSTYFSVNPSGTLLWHLLADGTTRGILVAALRDTYALPEDVAKRDVECFLNTVITCGLLDT